MRRTTRTADSTRLFDWAEHHQTDPNDPAPVPEIWGIDAMNLIFQLWFAMPEMTSPEGRPIAVLWGFLRDLATIRREHRPTAMYIAFDLHAETFRHALLPEYKANRPEPPEPLVEQIKQIRPLLEELGFAVVAQPGFEADDILATLAEQTQQAGERCVIVTTDKDCRQLLSPTVRMYTLRKRTFVDEASLLSDWEITPSQVVDYLSLVGDSVDNVAGVPMIGPKMARELLGQYGDWEGIQRSIDSISGERRRESLRNATERMDRNRQLIRLRRDVPCTFDRIRGEHPEPAPTAEQTLNHLGLGRYVSEF